MSPELSLSKASNSVRSTCFSPISSGKARPSVVTNWLRFSAEFLSPATVVKASRSRRISSMPNELLAVAMRLISWRRRQM